MEGDLDRRVTREGIFFAMDLKRIEYLSFKTVER